MAELVLDEVGRRLIAALQVDGRAAPERLAAALGLSERVVARRLHALLGDGVVRVVAVRPGDPGERISLLRVKVLRGKVDIIAGALARRPDVPFVDITSTGDEISAVIVTPSAGARSRLLFEQFVAASAVTEVTAQTVLRIHSQAHDWRLDVLSPSERAALQPASTSGRAQADEPDVRILAVLERDARTRAASVAEQSGVPATTVRRRLRAMTESGVLRTSVVVDPARLALNVDANLIMTVPPARLDQVARALAGHPAVHGVLATTGVANLNVAVWLRDLDQLYEFLTGDVAALGVTTVETVLVGEAIKRPGVALASWRH